jgi:signal transduction histidine kinase
VENRPIGFLFRSSRHPNAYAPRHVRLHQAMAARLSQAVEKVWRLDRLAATNAAYLEMLGFASHDLRSPLGGIILDTDLLLEGYLGDLDPRQQQKIGRIKQSAISLHAMAGQYLELARIESGELRVQREDGVDLWSRIVDPALALQEGALQAGRHPVEQDGPRPLTARLDPLLLRTACANLLGNAVKYGREGGRICIRAGRKEGEITLSVWNEGPGFPPDMRQRLFRRFSRLPAAARSQRKGAGLGLYIVWRIAQAHGGRVYADSREGEWAEFRLEIPDAPASDA